MNLSKNQRKAMNRIEFKLLKWEKNIANINLDLVTRAQEQELRELGYVIVAVKNRILGGQCGKANSSGTCG